ncbi:aminotransferase class V-fold PLP-dependent enzyme [Flavobacterium restrictum]|uniref:Aminotransferase class V-fold PLP-dependent enzyme n=1 Tax=Flavobacterium restrictum TaxID=2594428 RepID=A0A553EB67_9FLAO|nr:aminotransferase class V-fold PLP-dependent enzyme [Flavobacterium restrictum]TRX42288.1 aminotransferase class V-fold PLP-dependent enzyme [Flavobacterium restrictum]
MKSQFLLDPEITYLNHGAFGACPKPIFQNYQFWQMELEKNPTQFIQKKAAGYLNISKEALSKYVGCNPEDFFFVQNPTVAINTIMRSLCLKAGDEILATNHEYGAMDKTWEFYCSKSGAKYVRQNISLPVVSKAQLLTEFWNGYTTKTKVVFINHMSSCTALIFPVKEICEKARALGLIIIVDGAHVPGHIDLNIRALDPDFYTATTHKWMLTPKGNSFLYVKKTYQSMLEPLVVSWGYQSQVPNANPFLELHQLQGTRDISAFLTVPTAIQFLEDNNWSQQSQQSKQLILDNYQAFCDLLQSEPICPISSEFLGQMCSIPIRTQQPVELKELLYQHYKIEIPIMQIYGATYLRISINAYNSQADLDKLRLAIIDIQENTDLLN